MRGEKRKKKSHDFFKDFESLIPVDFYSIAGTLISASSLFKVIFMYICVCVFVCVCVLSKFNVYLFSM